MSSPKAASTTRRAVHPAAKRVPAQPAAKPASKIANGAAGSAEAKRLAAELERALASGRRDVLSTDALQALMAAVCKTYAQRGGATATDVMITASGLLKAANLAVFELGMWQSWTGR
jgi:hypothetical protein